MLRVRVKAVAVDALGHEQDVDVWLDVEEQGQRDGVVHLYGNLDCWRARFEPKPPFDPNARAPTEVLGMKLKPGTTPPSSEGEKR